MGDVPLSPELTSLHRFVLEEYRALRAESVRCSTVVSGALWLGVSGFVVTIGGAASIVDGRSLSPHRTRLFIASVVMLLLLQSIAATATFMGELYRFIRLSVYCREKSEREFKCADGSAPVLWETWIAHYQLKSLYLVQIAVLQFPAIGVFLLVQNNSAGLAQFFLGDRLFEWSIGQNGVELGGALTSALVLDIIIVGYLALKLAFAAYVMPSHLQRQLVDGRPVSVRNAFQAWCNRLLCSEPFPRHGFFRKALRALRP